MGYRKFSENILQILEADDTDDEITYPDGWTFKMKEELRDDPRKCIIPVTILKDMLTYLYIQLKHHHTEFKSKWYEELARRGRDGLDVGGFDDDTRLFFHLSPMNAATSRPPPRH